MAAAKVSLAVESILAYLKTKHAERTFDAEAAKVIWNGSKAAKLEELTQTQLLQFALIDAYSQRDEIITYIEQVISTQNPNRETRRKIDKKLHLPK